MAIMAEQARMEEERQRIMVQWELEEQQRREAVEMQLRMEEIQRAQEMEGEEEDKEQEMVAGPSVLKKRKMDDKLSFLTIMERKWKLTKFFKTVESNRKKIVPPCCQCEGTGVTCYGKTCGPGCWRCSQRKIGCSVVEAKKRKGKETEVIKVKWSGKGNKIERGETDWRTEAMEAMVVEMRRIVSGDSYS